MHQGNLYKIKEKREVRLSQLQILPQEDKQHLYRTQCCSVHKTPNQANLKDNRHCHLCPAHNTRPAKSSSLLTHYTTVSLDITDN